jgi:hypothetical protein
MPDLSGPSKHTRFLVDIHFWILAAQVGAFIVANTSCGRVDNGQHTSVATGGRINSNGSGGVPTGLGGSVAGGTDGGVNLIPVDTRPTAPVWDPDISLGDAGWRQSPVPYCDTHQQTGVSYAVWADSRGVWVVAQTVCALVDDMSINCDSTGMGLQFNDGTGWRWVYGDARSMMSGTKMRGFPQGPIVLLQYDPSKDSSESSVSFVVDGGVQVQPDSLGDTAEWGTEIVDVFATGPSHAYFLDRLRTDMLSYSTAVHEYVDGVWTKLATLPMSASALWAKDDRVVVVGSDQAIYTRANKSSDFVRLTNAPAGDYVGVWGFGSNDIWLSNSAGQLFHYDGNLFTVKSSSGAGQLWGADGELYTSKDGQFSHWTGTLETLIDGDAGVQVKDFWGISKSEVFLSVRDMSFASYKCGEHFAVWYDGATFHQF